MRNLNRKGKPLLWNSDQLKWISSVFHSSIAYADQCENYTGPSRIHYWSDSKTAEYPGHLRIDLADVLVLAAELLGEADGEKGDQIC